MALNDKIQNAVGLWTLAFVDTLKQRFPSIDTGATIGSISQDDVGEISFFSHGRIFDMRPPRGTSIYRIDKDGRRVKRLDRNRKWYNITIRDKRPDLIAAVTDAAIDDVTETIKRAFL